MMESLPPSIVENKHYAVGEGCLSNLCRFVTLMMSIPPIDGVGCNVDVEFDVAFEAGPSDGAHPRIIVFMDHALWKYFMLKKDLKTPYP